MKTIKRQKIEWTDKEKDILISYYLSLDAMTNKEKIEKTWNYLYNSEKTFGYFRSFSNVRAKIITFMAERNIDIPFAYMNPPAGYKLIKGFNYHFMNRDMHVFNLKTGKKIKTYINKIGVPVVNIYEKEKLSIKTRSTAKIYVDLFLDNTKPYQIQENGIPLQTEKFKPKGIRVKKNKP